MCAGLSAGTISTSVLVAKFGRVAQQVLALQLLGVLGARGRVDVGRHALLDLRGQADPSRAKLSRTVQPGCCCWYVLPSCVNASVSDAAANTFSVPPLGGRRPAPAARTGRSPPHPGGDQHRRHQQQAPALVSRALTITDVALTVATARTPGAQTDSSTASRVTIDTDVVAARPGSPPARRHQIHRPPDDALEPAATARASTAERRSPTSSSTATASGWSRRSPRRPRDELGLAEGRQVTVIVKAFRVMIAASDD